MLALNVLSERKMQRAISAGTSKFYFYFFVSLLSLTCNRCYTEKI